MSPGQIDHVIRHLKAGGGRFEAGLTMEEVQQVEQTFGLCFPPDLRAFLQTALPVSDGFVNWRWGIRVPDVAKRITERLQWPLDGILFDVGVNKFWLPQWGTRPAGKDEQEQVVRRHFMGYPKLIPIYSHRYLAALPPEAGNPVFSVYGTDIIYYGDDLVSYFVNEFRMPYPPHSHVLDAPRNIAFWSDFDEPPEIAPPDKVV